MGTHRSPHNRGRKPLYKEHRRNPLKEAHAFNLEPVLRVSPALERAQGENAQGAVGPLGDTGRPSETLRIDSSRETGGSDSTVGLLSCKIEGAAGSLRDCETDVRDVGRRDQERHRELFPDKPQVGSEVGFGGKIHGGRTREVGARITGSRSADESGDEKASKRHRLTQHEKAEIVRLRVEERLSIPEIAARMNSNNSTVCELIKGPIYLSDLIGEIPSGAKVIDPAGVWFLPYGQGPIVGADEFNSSVPNTAVGFNVDHWGQPSAGDPQAIEETPFSARQMSDGIPRSCGVAVSWRSPSRRGSRFERGTFARGIRAPDSESRDGSILGESRTHG